MSLDSIVLLLHAKDDGALRRPYRIWALRERWCAEGLDVRLQRGPSNEPTDAIVIQHVDLTRLPEAYGAWLDTCERVVNRDVRDVSKSVVSDVLVERGDGYTGPVIVKTDANAGGRRERKWLAPEPGPFARLLARLRPQPGLGRTQELDPAAYPIFESVDAVPAAVFDNPALVVERFLPEREGDLYVVHNYYVFGEKGLCFRRTARCPIVKGVGTVSLDEEPVPPAVEAARRRLGIDNGKIDFVVHDGAPVLLDVTVTPSYGYSGGGKAIHDRISDHLAAGIGPWLRQA